MSVWVGYKNGAIIVNPIKQIQQTGIKGILSPRKINPSEFNFYFYDTDTLNNIATGTKRGIVRDDSVKFECKPTLDIMINHLNKCNLALLYVKMMYGPLVANKYFQAIAKYGSLLNRLTGRYMLIAAKGN